jgi:hypothetical protein
MYQALASDLIAASLLLLLRNFVSSFPSSLPEMPDCLREDAQKTPHP